MTNKKTKGEIMSASNGGIVRRRLSLLAGSSLAAATAIFSAGGVMLAPTAALAANECAPIGTDPSANGAAADTFACAGAYPSGITYSSAGALTVNSTGAMNVGATGINLTGNTSDSVTFTATGVVTGTAGPVIDVRSVSGPISITSAGVTGTNANVTYGILAVSTGGGAVSVSNMGGNVNATSAAGAQIAGIRAVSMGGNGAVTVTTTGTVTGRQHAIQAQSSGTGALTITANGAVNTNATAGVANIDATTGTGLLTINLTEAPAISGIATNGNAGAAIRTNAGGDAVINIGANRTVTAGATSTAVLNLTAAGTTTVNTYSNLGNVTGPVTVRAAGGGFALNVLEMEGEGGDGQFLGRLDLTGVTGAVTINNEGRWLATGVSVFGPGASVFTNTNQFATRGPVTTFTSLETFDNSGRMEFGDSRNTTTELLSSPGTAFTGAGDSQLIMEANLGTVAQLNCSAAVVADCFSLVGGSTSGVTSVLLTALGDITTEANTAGIVLIDVNGGESHAGDFVLDPTSTNYTPDAVYGGIIRTDGVLGFALRYDEESQRHYLGSVVPGNRLEYVGVLQEVVSIWHSTSDIIAGRQADLRDGGSRGAWLRVGTERSTRDVDLGFMVAGASFNEVDEYELSTTSAIDGLDLLAGDNFVLGIHGGGVKAELERVSSLTTDQVDGVTAGVYGAVWNERGLTLDGTINANLLSIDHDRPVEEVSGTSVTSIGARGEAGWRVPLGEGFYVQPLATVSYMRAEIEEVIQTGFDATWSDVSSLRGALGVRAGGDLGPVGFWIAGRAWKEFTNDGVLLLGTTAEEVEIHDDLVGEFQEVGAGLILSAGEALEGFVSGGAKFADGADSYNASVGIRLRW